MFLYLSHIQRKLFRFESEVRTMKLQMDNITGVYDDLNEKMHDVDKTM